MTQGGTASRYVPTASSHSEWDATEAELDRAAQLTEAAFRAYRDTSPEERAAFLEGVAAGLEREDTVVSQAELETHLGLARLKGELARTTGQPRMFADLVRKGSWVDAASTTPPLVSSRVALVTDARFSGVSTGACIGHVGPEGLAGGPIGKVRDGDWISIMIDSQDSSGPLDFVGEGDERFSKL